MRVQVLRASLIALLCVSCGGGSGGYGGSSSTPTNPTPTPTPTGTSNAITITISGNNGSQSFSPNPAMCATGQTVIWKNADSTTHRIVIQELGIDTGNLAPGASSQPVALGNVSKNYHCTLHPTMVGSLNDATNDPGSCGPYGCY
jgi:plastocyanin